jgi:flavin-dependent dehydrogenase
MTSAVHDAERVLIIGASLAGTMAALSLVQAGVRVTLIDKDSFPRRKPCGEGLSARGQAELKAAGCSLAELGCSYKALDGYRIYRGRRFLDIPERAGLVGVQRVDLDDRLLQRARLYPNLEILLGAKATVVDVRPGACEVSVNGAKICGATLIIADGAQSPTLRALGRSFAAPKNPRLGSSSVWQVTGGSLPSKVHTILVRGGEIYITPLANEQVNISALGDRSLIQPFSREHSLKGRIDSIAATLGVSLSPVSGPLSCGPINTLYRGAQCFGAYVVGDACETFDPCAGFGMAHAVLTGRLAAHRIVKSFSSSEPLQELAAYEREREQRIQDVRGFTRLTAATMTSGVGRMSLPLLVSTGLAARVSEAVHSVEGQRSVRRLVSFVGLRSSRRRDPHIQEEVS